MQAGRGGVGYFGKGSGNFCQAFYAQYWWKSGTVSTISQPSLKRLTPYFGDGSHFGEPSRCALLGRVEWEGEKIQIHILW